MASRERDRAAWSVLVLGGAGKFGLATARRLAALEPAVEVAVGGRSAEALDRAILVLGARARPVQVDISDAQQVAAAAAGFDAVINTAGPEWAVCLPSLEGAIAAGTHYCDIGAHGPTTEAKLGLDAAARERGVTAWWECTRTRGWTTCWPCTRAGSSTGSTSFGSALRPTTSGPRR